MLFLFFRIDHFYWSIFFFFSFFFGYTGLCCGKWASLWFHNAGLIPLQCVGSSFPHQGWNPHPPHEKADSWPLAHLGSPLLICFQVHWFFLHLSHSSVKSILWWLQFYFWIFKANNFYLPVLFQSSPAIHLLGLYFPLSSGIHVVKLFNVYLCSLQHLAHLSWLLFAVSLSTSTFCCFFTHPWSAQSLSRVRLWHHRL